jgi:hypothetical protein
MFTIYSGSGGVGHIQEVIILVLIATVAVIFWRDMAKILLLVVMFLLIILAAFGVVFLIDGIYHVIE